MDDGWLRPPLRVLEDVAQDGWVEMIGEDGGFSVSLPPSPLVPLHHRADFLRPCTTAFPSLLTLKTA